MDLLWRKIGELAELLQHSEDPAYIYDIIWAEISLIIRNVVAQAFTKTFAMENDQLLLELCEKDLLTDSALHIQINICDKFSKCTRNLKEHYDAVIEMLQQIEVLTPERNLHVALQEIIREAILTQLPVTFNCLVYIFYRFSYNIFKKFNERHSDNITSAACKLCDSEDSNDCKCKEKMLYVDEVNRNLIEMGLLDRIAGLAMTSLVQKSIKSHISETCEGRFDKSHLKELEDWLNNVVIEWLYKTFNFQKSPYVIETIIEGFKVKLRYFLYEIYAWSIIDQFFTIIIDFPDSIPAIDDLKVCIEKVDMRKHLITAIKSSLEARILHPGVNTIDILTSYISAIKAIRHLDSSGVILETVTAPIKDYLRRRSDTVRRVVTSLTEEGPTDLAEELARGEALKESTMSSSFNEFHDWETWKPDLFGVEIGGQHHGSIKNSKPVDIIAMIIDIYGTKELFVNEYRNLMADRLLTQLDFNAEREIRNLELLKIRFGEQLLHNCEVMLKDVTDSKRINAHIQNDTGYGEGKNFELSALIVSAQFWPPLNKESLELPPEFATELNKYTKSFEAYKGNRTLNWRTVTGRVNISIEMGNRSVDMWVTPTQAVILYHFQEKEIWNIEELSNVMRVPVSILRRRISFWLCNGYLTEKQTGLFQLTAKNIENTQLSNNQSLQQRREYDDIDSAMASANDQRAEELQIFWSYIVGMLTNLDSLPIERMHQMLRLFASDGLSVEFSQDDLKEFLQGKVREHKLIFFGGVYQLPNEEPFTKKREKTWDSPVMLFWNPLCCRPSHDHI